MKLFGNHKIVKNNKLLITFLLFILTIVIASGHISDSKFNETNGYRFNIFLWELEHIPSKLVYEITSGNLFRKRNETYIKNTKSLVYELETISKKINEIEFKLSVARSNDFKNNIEINNYEKELENLIKQKNLIRNRVEGYIESLLTEQIRIQKLSIKDIFVWPPVDFRIDSPPKLLVVSPRDKILRLDEELINSSILTEEMSLIEDSITKNKNLSAVVLQTGGLATYPSIVPSNVSLLNLLETVSHEWLHSYLIFFPLGRAYFSDGQMLTINETLANMFGKELALEMYLKITDKDNNTDNITSEGNDDQEKKEPVFSYNKHMQKTRIKTEELLSEGKIIEAEKYMEDRRLDLNKYGYNIRKINQAYFAFYGSYADSPQSISPIYKQLQDLREKRLNIGELVNEIKNISTYEDFRLLLNHSR